MTTIIMHIKLLVEQYIVYIRLPHRRQARLNVYFVHRPKSNQQLNIVPSTALDDKLVHFLPVSVLCVLFCAVSASE